ncbi:MAG: hypothetical protein H6797_01890 [Candidatus Nomurabacteria bacterium]|nr:MAG: hypothetical protein H6797_01890 [Candidatus Nomurabacteria bacterium]
MNKYIESTKAFISDNQKTIKTVSGIAFGLLALAVLVALFIYNVNEGKPNIVYQPVKACELLTPVKAEDLLGDKVYSTDANKPVISGNTATSKCGYTDRNPDQTKMLLAAVSVRSAINNKGTKQNKTDFEAYKKGSSSEAVKDVGDSAYFDKSVGQLNVLSGRMWLKFFYGVGSAPEANTLENAVKLAQKVLQ